VVNAFEDGVLEQFAEQLRSSRSHSRGEKVLAQIAAQVKPQIAGRGRLRLRGVRHRHHRNRTVIGARAGGIRRLRARRARRWPIGLGRKPRHAGAFYATIAVATLGGAVLNFAPINPIKALFWSAVINGVVAVPVMTVMMLMGRNRKIMGDFVLGGWLLTIGWLATAVMGVCVLGMAAMVIAEG
jgi:hypothetical protein